MRVLVVDDHDLVRRGICSVLATEPTLTICGEAIDGQDAVKKAIELRPDIVVMDISMPRLNGLEATREIKRLIPNIEILIVSQHDSQEMIRQAFSAGARAYVVKSSISTDLVKAIRKASNRESFVETAEPVGTASRTPGSPRNPATKRQVRKSSSRKRGAFSLRNEQHGRGALHTRHRRPDHFCESPPAAAEMFGWTAEDMLGKKNARSDALQTS